MPTPPHPLRHNRLASLLLEAANSAILLGNSKGLIEAVNPIAERTFGYSEAELLGRSVAIVFPQAANGANESHPACILAQLSEPTSGPPIHVKGRRKDGSTFSAEVTIHRLTALEHEIRDHDKADGDTRLVNVIELATSVSPQQRRIESERIAAVLQMVEAKRHLDGVGEIQIARAGTNPELSHLTGFTLYGIFECNYDCGG
ncbi:PAS fold protein [Rubripirellula tenax]|uniref:PAS fold protein n=1 Tax=Rubripirellula tenax TaxID=2528015 RepID=A0A5C6EPQ6_9BACT|nr:PAS domain S-box protein [Rubripirellula tenax]TWU50585.1 PAS fold protein [Rubripirellula tenax]